jgi:hypothetical protein
MSEILAYLIASLYCMLMNVFSVDFFTLLLWKPHIASISTHFLSLPTYSRYECRLATAFSTSIDLHISIVYTYELKKETCFILSQCIIVIIIKS